MIDTCKLVYSGLTEDDKREICSWNYDGKYAIYNLPSYEGMQERKSGFLNPEREKNFLGFREDGMLVGFVNILEERTEVFIGIGVKPDCCGKHYGHRILEQTCRISKEKYPEKPLYLEVRTWNLRAVRCYQNAGFRIDGEPFQQNTGIGTGEFYRMVRA